jgi:hypothetical protein
MTLLATAVINFEEEATRAFSPGHEPGTNSKTKRGSEGLAEDCSGVNVVGGLKELGTDGLDDV